MPFVTYDLREAHVCYADVEVPDDVVIPTTDLAAWHFFPDWAHVYNRMELARRQGVPSGPLELNPESEDYPVFVKPIYNFRGGGWRSGAIRTPAQFERVQRDTHGMFWTPVYSGTHRSIDLVLVDGRLVFHHACTGYPAGQGMFDRWESAPLSQRELQAVTRWTRSDLAGYTGAANVEMIGGRVIEAHLRTGDIDLCGDPAVVQAIVDAYSGHSWPRGLRADPFAVVPLFAPLEGNHRLDRRALTRIEEMALTMTLEDNPDDSLIAPGGRRLLVFSVPLTDINAARAARRDLARASGIPSPWPPRERARRP